MKRILLPILSLVLCLYLIACGATPCVSIRNAQGQTIRLSGVVHKEEHWGPPNFGENPKTDSKFVAWVLHLDEPLRVAADAKRSPEKEISVIDIQLEMSGAFSYDKIAALEKEHVIVEGQLWKATTPGDVTDLNVTVTQATIGKDVVKLPCEE